MEKRESAAACDSGFRALSPPMVWLGSYDSIETVWKERLGD